MRIERETNGRRKVEHRESEGVVWASENRMELRTYRGGEKRNTEGGIFRTRTDVNEQMVLTENLARETKSFMPKGGSVNQRVTYKAATSGSQDNGKITPSGKGGGKWQKVVIGFLRQVGAGGPDFPQPWEGEGGGGWVRDLSHAGFNGGLWICPN